MLGYLWSLARPLLLFGVLYVVFSHVAKVGADVAYYPVYLLSAIVLFTFFSEATGLAVTSLVAREALLRKVHFPRMVVPLSVVLTSLFNLGMNWSSCSCSCSPMGSSRAGRGSRCRS